MNDMGEDYTDDQIQEWDKEDMGNLPDGFFLSQSEIEDLRNKKRKLKEDAEKKIRQYMKDFMKKHHDELQELAEIERQEILDIAREGMVKYKDALDELKDK
jgi:vacuolar-type H+-ATPase subunit H